MKPLENKIQPLSSFIQPLYQHWSQPEMTQETVLAQFQEMLEKDFNEIDPNGQRYPSRKLFERFFNYEFRHYKHKTENNIVATIVKATLEYPDMEHDFPEVSYEYRLYDSSQSIDHYHYGIIYHESRGEFLITPVPSWAEHITIAKNGLVMLRPLDPVEAMGADTISQWPLLNERTKNDPSLRP